MRAPRPVNHQATFWLMDPENPCRWLSIQTTVSREISEDDQAEGKRTTEQLNGVHHKYTGGDGDALRDPSFDERWVLFELKVDSVATCGRSGCAFATRTEASRS